MLWQRHNELPFSLNYELMNRLDVAFFTVKLGIGTEVIHLKCEVEEFGLDILIEVSHRRSLETLIGVASYMPLV